MSEIYICTGCYETQGEDEPSDYCDICESGSYFTWIEVGPDEYSPYWTEDDDEDI